MGVRVENNGLRGRNVGGKTEAGRTWCTQTVPEGRASGSWKLPTWLEVHEVDIRLHSRIEGKLQKVEEDQDQTKMGWLLGLIS